MMWNLSMNEDSPVGAMDNIRNFCKPELGRVTGADGVSRDALVYGFPKRFELDYLQGDEVEGFEGASALASVANLLTQSGKPPAEGEMEKLVKNEWRKVA